MKPLFTFLVAALFLSSAAAASAATFFNSTNIVISQFGPAAPYPSSITVSNQPGTVLQVTVTLTNLSHAIIEDVDLLLVGPSGESVMLMSDVGGFRAVSGLSVTFDDAAPNSLPESGAIASGSYRPTNIDDGFQPDVFVAPAPTNGYGASFSVFSGTNPNGQWRLYALDDTAADAGLIAGGWSLLLNSGTPSPVQPLFTSIQRIGADLVRLQGTGSVSAVYSLQQSSSLTNWTTISTVVIPASGQFTNEQPLLPTTNRFFRLRTP